MDSDLDDFYAYASNPKVGRMAGWKAHTSKEEALAFIRSDWWRNECLAIYHLHDKKVIGTHGLHKSWAADDKRFSRLKSADMGYTIHPDYWNMGIATEATKNLINHCFTYMDVDLITCGHFKENLQSKRVIQKCGFAYDHQEEIYVEDLDTKFVQLRYVLFSKTV